MTRRRFGFYSCGPHSSRGVAFVTKFPLHTGLGPKITPLQPQRCDFHFPTLELWKWGVTKSGSSSKADSRGVSRSVFRAVHHVRMIASRYSDAPIKSKPGGCECTRALLSLLSAEQTVLGSCFPFPSFAQLWPPLTVFLNLKTGVTVPLVILEGTEREGRLRDLVGT